MTGLTEEAAVEGHDLIQHAEEEAGMRPQTDTPAGKEKDITEENKAASGGTADESKTSKIDSIKEALHLKK
ncbi:hypothetical protein DH86_00001208 [Scytalidium sp. 3C]|nr:hypothetical protein DH86_00001208 [Scytalidium sp. 3C]